MPRAGTAVLKFFEWAYKNGDKMADELDYVPMPDNVVELIASDWSNQIKGAGRQAHLQYGKR